MNRRFLLARTLFLTFASLTFIQPVFSCDLCSIYIASEAHGESPQALNVSLSEQFTHFGTMQRDGARVPDDVGQYLNSAITQIVLGYRVTEAFSLQLNVPYIHREFRRPENFSIDSGVDADGDGVNDFTQGTNIEHGTETGLGDVSLIGNFTAVRLDEDGFIFRWNILGGVKFPTGNSGRISEELREIDVDGAPESGIHGHDLTLGSGSFDGILGTSVSLNWKRAFLDASVQYSIRSEGDYGYQFANDLTWSGGPGFYLWLEHEGTLALAGNVSGESKGRDTFRGERADDTGVTAVYLGPRLIGTYGEQFSADIGVDLPQSIQNTALQLVPDYRVHAAITWRF